MHYEVELCELAYAADADGELRITGSVWKPIMVFQTDAVPVPLAFASLDEARAYAARDRPERVRVVRVADDGTRELV